jgi:branched-chain amino acid transport system ATP-binding protein
VSAGRGGALEIDDVSKHYSGLAAVDGLSFSVAPGELLGIAGPNGAGKTTLFDLISGHTRTTSGAIRFDGEEIQQRPAATVCRMGIARTFQIPTVFSTLTVFGNAMVGAHFGRARSALPRLRPRADDEERALAALEQVGLAAAARRSAHELSVFDRKRLMLASALASEPRVLMLDEPVGGLTVAEADRFTELIRSLRPSGITIVLIEHIMRVLTALADRVLVMHHGGKLYEGDPAGLARDEEVVRVYLGRSDALGGTT